jgi:hypothetical protein
MKKVAFLALDSSQALNSLWLQSFFGLLLVLLGIYALLAYVVLPALWRHYEHNPQLEEAPKTTRTAEGIPGDPLNIGLVGTQAEVVKALLAAGWHPADPITLKTSIEIAESVLLKRPDPKAPVSNLYLWGRKQDLAFELPVGDSAKQRHHVRLWQSDSKGTDSKPLWIGSATFDHSVGLSHLTGQITHHIQADVDTERDTFVQNLSKAQQVKSLYQVTGVGATLYARNGGGDRYYTDGELTVVVVTDNSVPHSTPPTTLPNPILVETKNRAWSLLRRFL